MKEHWWFLTLFWLDDDQEIFSTVHVVFFKEMENSYIYSHCFFKTKSEFHICLLYFLH